MAETDARSAEGSSFYDTLGDPSDVACPHCGEPMNLRDWETDGCLMPGECGECEHCGAGFKIVDVAYCPTVWLKREAKA